MYLGSLRYLRRQAYRAVTYCTLLFFALFLTQVPPRATLTTELIASHQLPVPEPMQCMGDVSTNWKVFWEAYSDYATATELGKKEKAVQAATLKTVMGKECRQILGRLELSREEMNDEEIILTKLESIS